MGQTRRCLERLKRVVDCGKCPRTMACARSLAEALAVEFEQEPVVRVQGRISKRNETKQSLRKRVVRLRSKLRKLQILSRSTKQTKLLQRKRTVSHFWAIRAVPSIASIEATI